MKNLIAFTGPAGSGKDTAAETLIALGYQRYAFAQGLKDMLAAIGWPEPINRANKEVANPNFCAVSYRQAAQTLGTEWGRKLHEDFWVSVMRQRLMLLKQISNIYDAAPEKPLVVITDLRFENEASMVRELGGIIIHLTGRAADLGQAAAHVSEAGIARHPADYGILNNGSIENLRQCVLDILGERE